VRIRIHPCLICAYNYAFPWQEEIRSLQSKLKAVEAQLEQQQLLVRKLSVKHRGILQLALKKVAFKKVQQLGLQTGMQDNPPRDDSPMSKHVRLPKIVRSDSPTMAKGKMPVQFINISTPVVQAHNLANV
jgi:hypothetical protein